MRRALYLERWSSPVPTKPNSTGSPGPYLRSLLPLPDCTFGGITWLWGASFPRIRHSPIISRGKPSTVLQPTSPLQKKSLPATFRSLDGYPPVGVGVGGHSRSSRSRSPGTEATHVSRRIFLSATTSPVSLFLALYTTPYVPSPIFSTFWKFSMKRY